MPIAEKAASTDWSVIGSMLGAFAVQMIVQWKKSSKDKNAVEEKVNDESRHILSRIAALETHDKTTNIALGSLKELGDQTKNRVSAVAIGLKNLELAVSKSDQTVVKALKEIEESRMEWISKNLAIVKSTKP